MTKNSALEEIQTQIMWNRLISVWISSMGFFVCSLEGFVFTYRTDEEEIADAFARWLDTAVAVALKEYGDRL